jgi:hypothetical protein
MRLRGAFLVVAVFAAVLVTPALASAPSWYSASAVRQTVADVVSAMRADDGPRVCSLKVRVAQYQYVGRALDGGGPCGPIATATLKDVKWAEPPAEALHAVAQAKVRLIDARCTPMTGCTVLWENEEAAVWLHPSHDHWLIAEVPDLTFNWGLFLIAGEPCKAIPGCQKK